MKVETSRQPVALVTTALSSGSRARMTARQVMPAPQPAHSRWPPTKRSGFSSSFLN